LPMTKVARDRSAPRIGPDAFVGVKHSSTFSRLAQRRIAGSCSPTVVHDHEQPVAAAGRRGRLERGQGVTAPLCSRTTPHSCHRRCRSSVEVADAVGAVVGRRSRRASSASPSRRRGRADGQRAELVKGKAAVRVMVSRTRSGPAWRPGRIAGLLPGPGPLEGDAAGVQDLPQPLPPDRDWPGRPLSRRPAARLHR